MQSEQTKMLRSKILEMVNDNSNTIIPDLPEWIDTLIASANIDSKQERIIMNSRINVLPDIDFDTN